LTSLPVYAVPSKRETLRLAIGKAHRRYTRRINFRKDWRGHLWQERFSSFVMDEPHFLLCLRYVENNPVRAKLVKQPQQRPWSSASVHIKAKNDILVNVSPALSIVQDDWKRFLSKA
jgi:putative transposase